MSKNSNTGSPTAKRGRTSTLAQRVLVLLCIERAVWRIESTATKAATAGAPLGRSRRAGNRASVFIRTLNQAKRFLRILFGFTLLVAGIAMIATPGPGWLTILLALGVLAAEFMWARRLLDRLKLEGERIRNSVFPSANHTA
jgi:Flp pilus assembly protein TadB